jgi:hypothetical protein
LQAAKDMLSSYNKIKNAVTKKRFFSLLTDNPQDWVTSVFYSSCIAIFILLHQHFNLTSFNGRIVSRATIEDFDISARVDIYYLLLLIFFVSCIIFKLVATKIETFILLQERNLINYVSLGGILFLLFGAFTVQSLNIPVNLVFVAHGILFCKILFRIFKKEKASFQPILEYDIFIFSLLYSVIVFILLKRISLIFNHSAFVNFYIFILVIGILIYCLLWNHLIKFKDAGIAENKFRDLLNYLKPFPLLPFVIVLTTELYFFLNSKSIFYINQITILFSFIVLLFLWFLFEKFNKFRNESKLKNYRKLLYNYHFPLFIAGITSIIFYSPILTRIPGLFEGANPALSVEQFFDFHKIPFISTFNAHELSEIFFPFIYTTLYGFKDLSFLLYDFIPTIIGIILIYFFLLKITRNPYLTIFVSLFFPFVQILFPLSYSFILVTPLILIYTLKRQTVKSFFLFFSFLLFLIIWRIDFGFAAFPAGIILLVLYAVIFGKTQFNYQTLKKGIFYFLIFSGLLFTLVYIVFGQKFIISIRDIYSYFDSAQSYGFPDLAEKNNLFFFLIQYFAFPIIIIGLIAYATILLIKTRIKSSDFTNSLIAYIFLGIFYFLNFHRGLVRHALIENSDTALTSFGFFLIGGSLFFIKYLQGNVKKFIFFIMISSLLVLAFKFPREDARIVSFYGQFISKTDSFPLVQEEKYKIKRVVEDANYARQNYNDIVKFLKSNLKENETFIDFTNTPMLYFYAQNENPIFFNQSLICSHNEYLQKRFIDQVKQYNIPFVVFSKYPESSSDIVDGIPNTLRHFLIAEYIYQHYKPFVIINNFCVWENMNFERLDSNFIIENHYKPDLYSTRKICFPDLKYLPYIWGQYDAKSISALPKKLAGLISDNLELKSNFEKRISFTPVKSKSKGNYLIMEAQNRSKNVADIKISYGMNDETNGSFIFKIKNDNKNNRYILRLSAQYNWMANENNWISVLSNDDIVIESMEITEAD